MILVLLVTAIVGGGFWYMLHLAEIGRIRLIDGKITFVDIKNK